MFSRLVLRAARVTPTSAVGRPLALARPSITPVFQALSARSYAAGGPDVSASYKNVEARILDIFRTFDKVNQDNLTTEASFTKDLGLDSLDAVEVVMAIEEEFMVEIPDAEADEIKTVKDAIDYIIACPEAGPH